MTTIELIAAIIANLTGTSGRTAADVAFDLGITRQKAAAVLRQLVADGKVWRHQVFADRGARYGIEVQADGPGLPPAGGAETRLAAGYVCTVLDEDGWSVSYSADDDDVREELYDATVRTFADGPSADAHHAELVARFSAPDAVEELSEQVADTDGRRQVVPVLFAMAAAWTAFAAGQQVGQQVYRPTASSAKAALVEAHVLRRAVDDDPSDPFEGRVSRPAGTPRAAVPFVEEVAS